MKRSRGRPRAFDEGAVLAIARDAFWSGGLAGVSLDEVAAATGVARPSLAAAFGDKRALYLRTIDDFIQNMEMSAARLMSGRGKLHEELTAFFRAAIGLYVSGSQPRGCLAMCTLPVEAVHDEAIRTRLADVLVAMDATFEKRFRLALAQGEFPPDIDTAAHAALTAALLQSVAIRARAGATKASLNAMAKSALGLICGMHEGRA